MKQDGALGSGLLAEVGGSFDRGCGPGDDGLIGGVEVRWGDNGAVGRERFGERIGWERSELVGDLRADFADEASVEAEDGGHGSFARRHSLLHVAAAGAHDADRVGEGESAGGDVGGVLSEAVAGGEGGVDTALGEDTSGGD